MRIYLFYQIYIFCDTEIWLLLNILQRNND